MKNNQTTENQKSGKRIFKNLLYFFLVILTAYILLLVYIIIPKSSDDNYEKYYICSKIDCEYIIPTQTAYGLYLKLFMDDISEINQILPTPIIWAIGTELNNPKNRQSVYDLINHFLKKGVDINQKMDDERGYTVLHTSVISDDVQMVRFLISKGANPNIKNAKNQTALEFAKFILEKRLASEYIEPKKIEMLKKVILELEKYQN